MRQTAQCLGRVMRGKDDYGLMVLADKRYCRKDKHSKLPEWIRTQIEQKNVGLSIDLAGIIAQNFYRQMGQSYEVDRGSYLTEENFEKEIASLKKKSKMAFHSSSGDRVALVCDQLHPGSQLLILPGGVA